MTQELTLTQYAQSIGKTKKAVECMVFRGELNTILKDGRRYVPVCSEDTQSILTETLQGTQGASVTEEGIWTAIAEQTELFEQLRSQIAEQQRTIRQLNAACNDLLDRTVELERQRREDRQELVRIGHCAGAYAVVKTREEREQTVTAESSRARSVGFLGRLVGQRT